MQTSTNHAVSDHLQACRLVGQKLFLPDYQIPKTDFPRVKRAIEGIGGKWSSQKQAFQFQDDPSDLYQRVLAGENIQLDRAYRKDTQFFFTPKAVLDVMEQWIFIPRDARVLEPSAGRGHIAHYLSEQFSGYPWQLDCCELDPTNRQHLTEAGFNLVGDDFLSMPFPKRGYHLIVANPPFTKNQDVEHFQRMYDLLAPGGRLVTVMSRKWQTCTSSLCTNFRETLNYYFHEVVDLEPGAFNESGTGIATCILMIDKPLDEAY
jgi:type I restriction-modification system DNA methylase subunit